MSFNIQDLSKVNDDNQQNWPEGTQKVNEVNNAGRADEGMLARWFADWNGSKITTGTAPNYTISSDTAPTEYYDGFQVMAEIHADNVGGDNLNANNLGSAPMVKNGGEALIAGDLKAGMVALWVYRGTDFNLVSAAYLGTAAQKNVGTADDEIPTNSLVTKVPTGAIIMYGAAAAPSDFLLCDGSAVSRTTYAELFGVIGETYGNGDGSTTFNVPDMRGRTAIGSGQVDGTGTLRNLGDKVGAETVTLTINEMPAHTHQIETHGASGDNANIGSAGVDFKANHPTESAGGGAPHNNMQPSNTVNYIIKT